ncbi:MAG: UvrB/UvrC motif-containing protein [Candidatus Latescibacterota bacterium]
MKCQICRENPANIVFTKIVNNEKVVLHICGECAQKKGLTIEIGHPESITAAKSGIEDALGGEHRQETGAPNLVCEICGLPFAEFKKTGYVGCDNCYDAFNRYIVNILKQIHGSAVHQGKVPLHLAGDVELKKHVRTLRLRLQHCIEAEDYERAAELRDKIATLEGKVVKDGL